ncbi:ankyrin [Anaeromyces robustus]|uniref:Ankyrin n=1 Tax=Anaeromyces robustus TaxID=1754192 RepID=A0A1Y1WB67_9FUNG|nr:ankyrin [Anaeromyces robustus]|eukprot:ORX70404.1 ankyrin [Anaeromyces robustus]
MSNNTNKISEDRKASLIELVKKDNVKEMKTYLRENDILLKRINRDEFDILHYAIEYNVSIDMIKFIIIQCQYDNYIFHEPLLHAISLNHFKISDYIFSLFTLDNDDLNFFNNKFIEYLIESGLLNTKNFKYILNNKFTVENIDPSLICKFIDNFQNEYLNILLQHFIFDKNFIINILNDYKNQTPLSQKQLEDRIITEKNKIQIDGTMYEHANKKNNNVALSLLFNHDGNCPEVLLKRIEKYRLLDMAIKTNNCDLIKSILSYMTFDIRSQVFESNITEVCKSNYTDGKMLKVMIDIAFKKMSEIMMKTPPTSLSSSSSSSSPSLPSSPNNQYINLILNIIIKANTFEPLKIFMEDEKYKQNMNINEKDINGEYPIITALYSDNLEILEYLLSKGIDYKIKNNNGVSLLFLAIQKQKYNMIQFLLKQNINIMELDGNGNYPLIKAIKLNDLKSVELLVDYGIKNNIDMSKITDNNGSTPLILSYRLNDIPMFKYLINYFDINQRDSNGNSLLLYAVLKNDREVINDLIARGADINAKDNFGNSILSKAIYQNNQYLIMKLLNNDNVLLNEPNNFGDIPLIIAIKCYPTKVNVDINPFDSNSNYQLYDSLNSKQNFQMEENFYKNIINILIEKGSNINQVNHKGKTALVYAIEFGLFNIEKLLIKNGAIINHYFGEKNISILMYAINLFSEINIIQYLLENNAEIDYKDEEGNTALVYAINNSFGEIANLLINYGADINNINHNNESILDIFKKNGYAYDYRNNYYRKRRNDNSQNDNNSLNTAEILVTRISEILN